MTLLEINNLHTYFQFDGKLIKAVNGVTFKLEQKETLGIIGESGSGKSQIAISILKLFQKNQKIFQGSIRFKNEIISDFDEKQMQKIRGNKIAMIFQDPTASLNPVLKIKEQITETLVFHHQISKKEAIIKSLKILKQVEIFEPERIMNSFPFQLSGGICQRIMIAIALSCQPELLIADEPTTAIDVLAQKEILNLIKKIQKNRKMAMLFITHDLSIIESLVENVIVLYKGEIIEKAPCFSILNNPLHPYTNKLLNNFLATSIFNKNLKKNSNFLEKKNNLFDFRIFQKFDKPDPYFFEAKPKHFVRCSLKK
jgi:peptide/nickel transport system ATP-binding protein